MGSCTLTVVAEITMKSFVAVLALAASVSAKAAILAGAYGAHPLAAGYGYPHGYGYTAAAPVAYAHQPVAYPQQHVAYAAAPAHGLYAAAAYDPSVAYANLYPVAEPYVHEEIAAEAYADAQIAAEPYIHEEIAAEPYVDSQIAAEPYVDAQIEAEAYAPAPVAYAHAP